MCVAHISEAEACLCYSEAHQKAWHWGTSPFSHQLLNTSWDGWPIKYTVSIPWPRWAQLFAIVCNEQDAKWWSPWDLQEEHLKKVIKDKNLFPCIKLQLVIKLLFFLILKIGIALFVFIHTEWKIFSLQQGFCHHLQLPWNPRGCAKPGPAAQPFAGCP